LGYAGPIGLQGYGIKMESRELLKRSMNAWRELQRRVAEDEQQTRDEVAALFRIPDLSPSLTAEEVRIAFPPPDKTVEELASSLSYDGAVSLNKTRNTLGLKLPTVTKLTLYSLLPYSEKIDLKYADLPRFHHYPILGEVTISEPDEANRWVSFLRDQILPGGLFDCGFMPRHGFRLSTSKGDIDILMCYSCDQLATFGLGEIEPGLNPVFSRKTMELLNRLFDKLHIPRDIPENKQAK